MSYCQYKAQAELDVKFLQSWLLLFQKEFIKAYIEIQATWLCCSAIFTQEYL